MWVKRVGSAGVQTRSALVASTRLSPRPPGAATAASQANTCRLTAVVCVPLGAVTVRVLTRSLAAGRHTYTCAV